MVSYGAPVEQAHPPRRRARRAGRPGDLGARLPARRRHQRAHGGGGLCGVPPHRAVRHDRRWRSSPRSPTPRACRSSSMPRRNMICAACSPPAPIWRSTPRTSSWAARPAASSPAASDLVRAAFLQNGGIGRGMKVGKEGIAGAIAALEAWERRDHAAVRARETQALHLWRETLAGPPGRDRRHRCRPDRQPARPAAAWPSTRRPRTSPPGTSRTGWPAASRPVIVRDHEIEHGYSCMDPCNLHPGEDAVVAARLAEELDRAQASNEVVASSLVERRARRYRRLRSWPD